MAARLWMLSCVVGGALLAQPMPTLRITSPGDRTVVHPGESLKVMVEATPVDAFAGIGVIGTMDVVTPLVTAPPYECTVEIPRGIRPGIYNIGAIGAPRPGLGKPGRDANHPEPLYSRPITLIVERADEPVRLEVYPPTMRLQVGIKGYLSVTGVFADGQQVDLKESTKMIYTSDTPKVVTVDPKSIVNPLAPGSAKITVSNGKANVEVPVTVSAAKNQ
jgi:hypothetical protein